MNKLIIATSRKNGRRIPRTTEHHHAIMNRDWRYIHFADETEEFHDLKTNPNEWTNPASSTGHAAMIVSLRAQAPDTLAKPSATPHR
jgi:hypothetical protein